VQTAQTEKNRICQKTELFLNRNATKNHISKKIEKKLSFAVGFGLNAYISPIFITNDNNVFLEPFLFLLLFSGRNGTIVDTLKVY